MAGDEVDLEAEEQPESQELERRQLSVCPLIQSLICHRFEEEKTYQIFPKLCTDLGRAEITEVSKRHL